MNYYESYYSAENIDDNYTVKIITVAFLLQRHTQKSLQTIC
jgi:hypothetical protein